MLKVLIAEDETITRVGLESLINWDDHGFHLVGLAENGKEALEIAIDQQPDIIITDVLMPIMSGIELIKSLNDKNILSEYIILSAYGEYKYVHEAMKMGVVDYLLKLDIEKETLLDVLYKAKEKCGKNIQKTISRNKKEICIKNIINNYYKSRNEILSAIERNKIKLPEHNLLCIVCYEQNVNFQDNQFVYPNIQTIMQTMNEIIKQFGNVCGCVENNRKYVFIMSLNKNYSEKEKNVLDKDIKEKVNVYFYKIYNFKMAMWISGIVHNYNEIHKIYHNLKKESDKINQEKIQNDWENAFSSIQSSIINLSSDKLIEAFDCFIMQFENNSNKRIEYLRNIIIDLIKLVNSLFNEYAFNKNRWNFDKELHYIDNNLESYSEMINYLNSIKTLIQKNIIKSDNSTKLIIKAKTFIEENYKADNIIFKNYIRKLQCLSQLFMPSF